MADLEDAIARANDLVIGASLLVMDTRSTEAMQQQGRYMMGLLSGIRDVLSDARDRHLTRAEAALVEAVMSDGERR